MDLKKLNYEINTIANLKNNELAVLMGRYPTYTSTRMNGKAHWTKSDIRKLREIFKKFNLDMTALESPEHSQDRFAGHWINADNKYLIPTIPDYYQIRVNKESIVFELQNLYLVKTEKDTYGGRVRKSSKKDCIDLIPENPEFSMFQIPVINILESFRILEARKFF